MYARRHNEEYTMSLLSFIKSVARTRLTATSIVREAACGPEAQQVVESILRRQLPHTVGATAIAGGPCHAVYFDADCTATVRLSGDATGVSKAYLGKTWYPEAAAYVTAVSPSTNCTVGWFQE
jgi:hypothetical protein